MTGSHIDRMRCDPGMAFGLTHAMMRVPSGNAP
jgi:hypothetical protein